MTTLNECLTALKNVLGETQSEISLHAPEFKGNELAYVQDCIQTGWVSSVGEYVNSFERKLVEYTEVPYAVAVVNGTAALHISLILADVKDHDEVLIPSLTFVATANAIIYCRAIPHFVDSCSSNLGIDIAKLDHYLSETTSIKNGECINQKTGRRIKAVVPVHIFGHPVDMEALNELAAKFCLTVIEDATESLGSFYKGKHTGVFGEIAVLSFNGNKIVTTGGGGAILTKNEFLAKKAKHLTTTAKKPHKWEFYHDEVGFNYRLPNINAALGCAQLEQLPTLVANKRALAQKYLETFASCKEMSILKEPAYAKSNYWLNALILNKPDRNLVEKIIDTAISHKYGLRGLWTPLDKLPMYQNAPKMDLSQTYSLFDSVISLPSSAFLGKQYA